MTRRRSAVLTASMLVYWPSLALAAQGMSILEIVSSLVLSVLLMWVTLEDLSGFRIPNVASGSVAGLGVVTIFYLQPQALASHILGAAVCWAALGWLGGIFFRRHGHEGLGLGDAKLTSAGVVWVGPIGLPSLMLVASMCGLIWSMYLSWKRRELVRSIPFGPFLAIGIWIVWTIGPIGI